MSIDRSRLKEYLKELRSLEGRVSRTDFLDRFEIKLLDLIARNQLDTDDLTFLRNEIGRLFKTEFAGFDTRLMLSYNQTLDMINDLYDDIGPNISRQFEKVRALEQVNRLQLGDYKDKTIESIAQSVSKGVTLDWSYRELEAAISGIGGKAERYAEALARTQVNRFARVTKYNKSLIAGVEFYEYAGLRRETNRPFCVACLQRIFHISHLMQMKNGNLEPVIINCGGWECIHHLEPDPTATAADAVSGKLYSLRGGAKIYGDEGVAKTFSYSFGLDGLVNRKGIKAYIKKTRKISISAKRIGHIRKHFPDMTDDGIRSKIGQVRSNPDRIYYQYNKGPGIVFEKNGTYVFISARKVKTMFTPADLEAFRRQNANYFVRLRNYE